jgi:NADH-quinone oxidoreductase subunit J
LKADAANGIGIGTIEAIGTELYTKYLLSFEAIAFLLLAATIGAILLAKKRLE